MSFFRERRRAMGRSILRALRRWKGFFFKPPQLPSTPDGLPHRRILIIRPYFLGDIVLCTPIARTLKKVCASCHITWLLRSEWQPLLAAQSGLVDDLISFPARELRWWETPVVWFKVFRRIRAGKFDMVFNLSWDRSTMLWTWLSGARWKLGIEEFGRPRLLSLFYTHSVESPDRRADNSSMADFYFAPMKLLGFSERVDAPQLVPSGCDLDSIDSFLSETLGDRSFVLIHPGSRLSHKRWPEEHFLTFVKMLSSRFPELAFVLACGPGESKWAASWMESFPGDKSLFLPNPTLGELIALAARCALFVGNDSGPMHLAAATGCPVLALFANPSRWEPLAEKKRVVIAPGGKMSGLRPEEVFKAAEELLLGISGADRAPHPNPLLREWGGSG